MDKYLRISSYIRNPFLIYGTDMFLQPIPYEFPYMWGKFHFLFISVEAEAKTTASQSRNLSEVCTDCTVVTHYLPHVFYMCVWSAVGNTVNRYITTHALLLYGAPFMYP